MAVISDVVDALNSKYRPDLSIDLPEACDTVHHVTMYDMRDC